MAPRNPVTKKTTSKAATKKSVDRVTKRPARGYHTFKNGMLNATPKEAEQDLVNSNQKTPLLKLPAEIRNRICLIQVLNMEVHDYDIATPFAQLLLRIQLHSTNFKKVLPALKRVTFNVFSSYPDWRISSFADCEVTLKEVIAPILVAQGYEVTVVAMETAGPEFDALWELA